MAALAIYTGLQQAILRKTIPAEAQVEFTGGTDPAIYGEKLIQRASTSTKAALLISQIVLGKVPVDGAKLDSLTAFAQAHFDYYASVMHAAPELGPYEALGRGFSGTPEFAAMSNGSSDDQFVTNVYVEAFGTTPAASQIQHFTDQISYFTDLYVNAGIYTPSAALEARGAVLGQIVGTAATQQGSMLDHQAEAWIRAAVAGTEVFNASIGVCAPASSNNV